MKSFKVFCAGEQRYLTEDETKLVRIAMAKGQGFVKLGKMRIFFDKGVK
jgi:hypothetical protein